MTNNPDKTKIYKMFVEGKISRSRAKDIIAEDWEDIAQAVSMQKAREVSEEYGYSPNELETVYCGNTGIGRSWNANLQPLPEELDETEKEALEAMIEFNDLLDDDADYTTEKELAERNDE